jgi:MarR family transcriptional regulator, organic hydroperoxide resistance regulator
MNVVEKNTLQQTIRQTRPFRSLGHEATVALLRTASVVSRRFSSAIEPFGITGQQYNVLRILRGVHPEPLPVLEIAERMVEATPGITGLLDRLETKGLVERKRCTEDRRQVHCYATEAGLALLKQVDPVVNGLEDDLVSLLSDDETEQLTSLLGRLRQDDM